MLGTVSYEIFSITDPSHQIHSSSPVSLHSDESVRSQEKNFNSISDFDLDYDCVEMNRHHEDFDQPTSIGMAMFDSAISHASIDDSYGHHNPILSSSSHFPLAASGESAAQIISHANVPEFLFQLTKMLSQEHTNIIEWVAGKIEVHDPHRLESEVLNKYFRHSKYASFQRQLNYFGFRKLAGKGKMAPCSYINENATADLKSLLAMKRKTSANSKDENHINEKEDSKKATAASKIPKSQMGKRSRPDSHEDMSSIQVAKIAVGKGVKHGLNGYLRTPSANTENNKKNIHGSDFLNNSNSVQMAATISTHSSNQSLDTVGGEFTFLDPSQLGMGLDNNFPDPESFDLNPMSSLNAPNAYDSNHRGLTRESSLVALAMIPSLSSFDHLQDEVGELNEPTFPNPTFVDFPDFG